MAMKSRRGRGPLGLHGLRVEPTRMRTKSQMLLFKLAGSEAKSPFTVL